jgi:hypothetical protein
MKTSSALQEGLTKVLRNLTVLTAASALAGLMSSCATRIQPPTTTTTPEAESSEKARLLEAWRASMAQIPLPQEGSFEASYPNKEWREVPSTTAPPYPYRPRHGTRPFNVGNQNDISAQAPSGFISSATGSFDSASVTSEAGQINGTGPQVADAYSLQLNTDFFTTTDCTGSSGTACQGWEQFVFANNGSPGNSGSLFIQYWLIKYNTTCPAGGSWNQFSFPGFPEIYCFKNSAAISVPNQPIANLGQLRLTGTVTPTGDSVILSTGTQMFARTGINAVHAAAGWRTAEFCVVGNAGGGMANFTSPSTIVPRTRITYGGTDAPICVATGFTGEENNLNFGLTAPATSPPGPAVFVTESSTGNAMANCATATTVGDTHLTTFKGLLYDFQASGDFVLAEVDPDFVVQTRQVSGAPTWPDASVNSAVATRMGKTVVALCLDRLTIDGKTTALSDGKTLSKPDGVDVTRRGNVYFITSPSGNSVRATVNPSYIDVSVGLGNCCAPVKGLLANAHDNVNQIAARDGTVLTNPFNFEELYHRFADSWRVSPKESLLLTCGDRETKNGIPRKPFYARDLDPRTYKRALAVAKRAGVKEGALLDAATLDVAVIGDNRAARVFVGAHAPVAVGKFAGDR